ncbi:MAG: hypothetical protein PHX08_25365 [Lachnospiraceae bacterium]|nr:hypothetical protein [Lachnospiraceae bacterium]
MDEKTNITPEVTENNEHETVVEATPVADVTPAVDAVQAQTTTPIVEPAPQTYEGAPNTSNVNYNNINNTGYNPNYVSDVQDETPMTMGDWVLTILALMIPCGVGIILYFVWAFGKKGNVNRRNYCRAWLIISGIVLVIYILFLLIFGAAFLSSIKSAY